MNGEVSAIKAQNAILRDNLGLLRENLMLKRKTLNNSLTGLASSFGGVSPYSQDNITSMLPSMQANLYYPVTLNYVNLSYMWKSHGVIRTMIGQPILDAFRGGLDYESQELDASDFNDLEEFAEERGVWESVKNALQWGRLYGGGGVVINVGQDWERPFDEKDVNRDTFELYDSNRWEFSGAFRGAKDFLFYGHKLDASRVLTYAGERAPHLLRPQLSGWGLSALESVVEDFNLGLRTRNVLYELLSEYKVDKYKIKDYAASLMTPDGEEIIRRRIQATNSIKNFQNALILDSQDEYEVVANQFAGLAEVMKEVRTGIAAAFRIPVSKLYGLSASGLNASNEEDLENYNAMVMSEIQEPAKPLVRKVLRLLQLAVFGKVYDLRFKFKPLRVLSATDEETIKTSKQARYVALYSAQLLDSKEVGELLSRDGLIPIQTKAQQGLLPGHVEVPSAESMFGQGADDQGAPMTETQRKLAAAPEMTPEQKSMAELHQTREEGA